MDKKDTDKTLTIFSSGCRCMNVSTEKIKNAIDKGANTIEKVGMSTSAGTGCGRCKKLIQILIDEKN